MRRQVAKVLLLFACLSGGAPKSWAAPVKTFDNFSELRGELLNLMGGATKRIWLTSSYLTDGEIVTALYVAQYRKVDVRVLLGRAKASFYMSRLNYLKNQNIPVYLKPDTFRLKAPTALLCDDSLIEVDGELDFMSKYKRFNMTLPDIAAAQAYATGFASAAALQIPAVARALPLVGRQRGGGAYQPPPGASGSGGTVNGNSIYSGRGGSSLPQSTPHYDRSDLSGAYTYDRKPMPRPDGVPTKLPKDLKYRVEQQRQQQAEQAAHDRQDQENHALGPTQPTVVTPLAAPAAGTGTATPSLPTPNVDSLIKSPVLKEDTEQGGD